jgi:HD-GYP domain-containing protein (c-di-GMP phosphodiesterase class II)
LYTKIVAITDVFDAMTSDRVYKSGVTPFDAFRMFRSTGLRLFDPHILNIFLSNLSVYYNGAKIRLPSGEFGDVLYVPPYDIENPVVAVGSSCFELSALACGNE